MNSIKVKLLVDCKEVIPTLARLWYEELGRHWVPNANIKQSHEKFLSHLNRDCLRLTVVVFCHEQPIAMASLRKTDGILSHLYRLGLEVW